MDKELLQKLVLERLSAREIGLQTGLSKTTIRYWIQKYSLTSPTPIGSKYCPRCRTNKATSEFYARREKEGNSTYCIQCTSEDTLERARKNKALAIEYKGGKCVGESCGYNRYFGALEFHHLDSEEKEFGISGSRLRAFNEKIKKELDKCILVCSNCHREIHGGMRDNNGMMI